MANVPTSSRYWHNPRCSKSRAGLELLRERGIEPELVDYLGDPPSVAELRHVLKQLQLSPREVIRTGEAIYSELGLSDASLSDDALIATMATHPRLIERPIFVHGDHAIIGRPPKRALELLSD